VAISAKGNGLFFIPASDRDVICFKYVDKPPSKGFVIVMTGSHSKMIGRLSAILFVFSLLYVPVPGYGAVTTSVSSGIALDTLEWTIGPSSSFPISELVFETTSWQNSFNVQWVNHSNKWFLEGTAGFGYVFSGSVVDRDFSLPRKQGEFSRSESEINGHNSLLFLLDGGYRIWTTDRWVVSLITGFTWTQVRYQFEDGDQIIPPGGANLSNLNSEYRARWYGPTVGFRWTTDLKPLPLFLFLEGRYWPIIEYRGKGNWNLRSDFDQNPSFTHKDDNGYGGDVTATLRYPFTAHWTLEGGWTGRFLRTSDGTDRTFFSDGTDGTIPLLDVSQDTHWFRLGLRYLW